ncbi:MAG: TIM barrel protein [Methanomassiliicoccales archaeon]
MDAVERAAALGLSAMELQFVRDVRQRDEVARAVRQRAEELDILLSAHGPYYISLASASPETQEKSRDWLLRAARAADAAGAWILVVHAGTYGKRTREETSALIAANVLACREQLDEEGNDIVIGLETPGKVAAWGAIAEVHEVMGQVRGVQPVLDLAHLHARGRGALRTVADFEAVLREYGLRPTERLHCHFSGIEFTAAGEKRHLPLDSLNPDFRHFASAFVPADGKLTVISETPQPQEGARLMLEQWRAAGGRVGGSLK